MATEQDQSEIQHDVVSNDMGKIINVNAVALKSINARKCGICGKLHAGKTLQVKSTFVFSTESEEEDESFCVLCTGQQLPAYISFFFKDDPGTEDEFWHSYYENYKAKPIYFSSKDTIRLVGEDGELIAPNTPGEMGDFGFRLYQLSKTEPMLNTFLQQYFLPHIRNVQLKKEHPAQVMHELCAEEGKAMLQRISPSSVRCSSALDILPPRVLRDTTPNTLRDMRRVHDFDHFINFLKKYK